MSTLAARSMAQRLTLPFARGADTMVLSFLPGTATQSAVVDYDFRDHAALFGRPPDPRYVVSTRKDVRGPTRLTVEYEVLNPPNPPTPGSIALEVPAGTLAGASFALDLGADEGPNTRLRRLLMAPAAPTGMPGDEWAITALLGNLARLLWVVGWERDHVRRQMERVKRQRLLSDAVGHSLDRLGFDLGIPRFPPLPHTFDVDTLALYHLDDRPGATPNVEDVAVRYGATAHHGVNVAARAAAGAPGRFGSAFAFRQSNAEIRVADHADFDLPATASFTVECSLKPAAGAGEGHALAKHANPANANQAGWALSIGEFGRGVRTNVRLLLSDGAGSVVTLFADASLDTSRFHHVAGVVDRAAGEARLYVEGRLVASAPIAPLGPMTNGQPLRMGVTAGAPFEGVLDEVRLSRVPRASFDPVLGEGDQSYRRRLRIFERWTLPTLPNLQTVLNQTIGAIGGDPEPLVLDDNNATMISGSATVTVTPSSLAAGECIDTQGNRRIRESEASGTASAETTFEPSLLLSHNDARATYTPSPSRVLRAGELPPDAHRMQVGVERRLNRLLDLIAILGVPGQLQVESAFDPRADDLRAVGRGVLLTHASLTLGRLAALAHGAGFSFACLRANLGAVYASVAPADYLGIRVTGGTATGADAMDLRVGETLTLEVRPSSLPADTVYRWVTIACGAGRCTTTRRDRPTITLTATAPGELRVKVTATRNHRTVSGTKALHVGLVELPDGESIGSDGALGVSETVAGAADAFFHPTYVAAHDDPRVSYGTALANRRIQPSVAERLDRLLFLIGATGAAGTLDVAEAFVAGATGLRGVGRAMTFSHSAVSPGRLGALAHAAGFTYVALQGGAIRVRQAAGGLVTVTAPLTVDEGSSIDLRAGPRAAPHGLAVGGGAVYVADSGTDAVSEIDPATGRARRAVKVGWRPVAVALSPDGQRLFTADASGNTVTAVTLSTGVTQAVAVRRRPVALAHHPTQPRLYVVCEADNCVQQIDTNTLTASGPLAVGARPTGIAVTPNGNQMWVAVGQDRRIAVISSGTFTSLANVAVPDEPLDVVIAPDGVRAYVSFPAAGRVRVLAVSSRTILDQFQIGAAPGALAMAPDGSALHVADPGPAIPQVHVLEPRALAPYLALRGSVRVRRDPVAVGAAVDRAYVANRGSDDVSVVDASPSQAGLLNTWRLGSGLTERLTWVTRLGNATRAYLSTTVDPDTKLFGERAGPLLARAIYSLADHAEPYTFEVRLKPALEANPALTITKAQYDLIMNILNAFHPVGIEVITRAVRERVVEVREGLLNAFPDYTYPNFRVRAPEPRRAQKE